MTTSQTGRMRIEQREGLKTSAYKDQRGIWTIGYGHTAGVTAGLACSATQADYWLSQDLATAENCINKYVRVALNQHQFDALVSFVFNIGTGAFTDPDHKGIPSLVLRKLNTCNYQGAADAMLAWNQTGGKPNPGLGDRRASERAQFMEPMVNS